MSGDDFLSTHSDSSTVITHAESTEEKKTGSVNYIVFFDRDLPEFFETMDEVQKQLQEEADEGENMDEVEVFHVTKVQKPRITISLDD